MLSQHGHDVGSIRTIFAIPALTARAWPRGAIKDQHGELVGAAADRPLRGNATQDARKVLLGRAGVSRRFFRQRLTRSYHSTGAIVSI
jgi:hypothetical protein